MGNESNNVTNGGSNDPLLVDLTVYAEKLSSMRSSVDNLVFDATPLDSIDGVNGTEATNILFENWLKLVGKGGTTDQYRAFYLDFVDKYLVNAGISLEELDDEAFKSLNMKDAAACNILPAVKALAFRYLIKGAVDVSKDSVAKTTSFIKKYIYTVRREEFMGRYHVDEGTMTRVEQMVSDYEGGDKGCIDAFSNYQNLSDKDWSNLAKNGDLSEFTDLSVLNLWSGYMLEHAGGNANGVKVYEEIDEDIVGKMYSFNSSVCTVDKNLVSNMKEAYSSLGADDSLAYNILTKIEGDSRYYIVYDEMNQPTPTDPVVDIDYDESGFVSVLIHDSYYSGSSKPYNSTRFLAAGTDYATEYFENLRSTADNAHNHGFSDSELIGMIQTVENPNDLRIMENIVRSDKDFKVDDKYAFYTNYWEENRNLTDGDLFYSHGISDSFSVILGQMGTTMLVRDDYENYGSYVSALSEVSLETNHDVMKDVASGAGVYVYTCAERVCEDEIGGDNDAQLKKELDSANYNFGILSQVSSKLEEKYILGFKTADYSDVKVGDISINPESGEMHFALTRDVKSGPFNMFGKEDDPIQISVGIKNGNIADEDRNNYLQGKLRDELDRKCRNIPLDSIIDLTGTFNPLLKDFYNVAKDVSSEKYMTMKAADLVKDGIKKVDKDPSTTYGVTGVHTVLGAIFKYHDAYVEFKKGYAATEDDQKINLFYSFNNGSGTVGIYDYDRIREVQRWNETGLAGLVGDDSKSNDAIYDSIKNDYDNHRIALSIIGRALCDKDIECLGEDVAKGKNPQDVLNEGYLKIQEDSNGKYTDTQIDNALRVLICGESKCNEDDAYKSVGDVPFDLLNACVRAISDPQLDGVNVYDYWR